VIKRPLSWNRPLTARRSSESQHPAITEATTKADFLETGSCSIVAFH